MAREFNEIRDIIEDSTVNRRRTCIVQKYIHNPLLINRRKFDIRTYALITSHNGNLKAYLYEEGYLRTSSREYSINNLGNKLVHLTNDAVQKRSEDYGKFEPGNKLSFNEFQMFIDKNYPDLNICFERDILPQMNKMTVDIFRACHGKLDPKRRLHCMEVFGLDFMIDDEFKIYLIEVNTNPCLELSCPLLARLIPNMLENAFKIGLDSLFLPPENFSSKKAFIGDACPENRFTLCYDDRIDGPVLDKLFKSKENVIGKFFPMTLTFLKSKWTKMNLAMTRTCTTMKNEHFINIILQK